MDIISLIVSTGGLVLAVWAIRVANTAEETAKRVVERKNEQEDAGRLRELISTLKAAKDAAMRRQQGAPIQLSAGTDEDGDVHLLMQAQDALKTLAPLAVDEELGSIIESVAKEIEKALGAITNVGSNRDGWKDALSTVQTIIRRLEQEDRRYRDRQLIPFK